MKIAVAYDNGNVFQHFGKTETFQVFETKGTEILSSSLVPTNGQGHGALADFLSEQGVELVICGGIGEGAKDALSSKGIKICAGAEGSTEEAVKAFLAGELKGSEAVCDHHEHEHDHDHEEEGCGGCGESQAGCGSCGGCHSMPAVTGKNAGHKCTVHYRGTLNDGTQFDSSYDRNQPLEFVCGAGMMIYGFDQAVADMEKGEKKEIHLLPEDAYGPHNPSMVMVAEIAQLPGSENLNVGERVALSDELGRRFNVTVADKDEKYITFDANHPMAGKELNFLIELVDVD